MEEKKVYYIIGTEIYEYELLKSGKKISWVFRPDKKSERNWIIDVDNDRLFTNYEEAKKSVVEEINNEIKRLEERKLNLK